MFRKAQTIAYQYYVIYFQLKCRILAEKFAQKFVVFEKMFPLFMTSLLRHNKNLGVYFSIFKKFKLTSIEEWPAINIIFNGSRVISN